MQKRIKKMYENYVCPDCWNQVQDCTCKYFPPWHLIMVDVEMQEIVRVLNNKGYVTNGSCSSHYNGNSIMYISFITPYESIGLPDGFSYAKGKTSIVYSFKKKERENKALYEEIKAQKINTMLEWALSLNEI